MARLKKLLDTDQEVDTGSSQEVDTGSESKQVAKKSSDLEIEIVNDIPEEDRGKEPLKPNDSPEPSADELEDYSDKVQKRIDKLKKAYHDERRNKEAKEREASEAYKYAKSIQLENKKLKENLSKGENVLVEEAKARAEAELAAAKAQYKKAYEDGDSDRLVDAQTQIASATVNQDKWNSYAPQHSVKAENTLQEQSNNVYNTENAIPKPDAKADAWFKENAWFGKDKEMTALAYGLHEQLVENGVDPRSDKYYDRINTRLRELFPDRFESNNSDLETDIDETTPSRQSTSANVVAPVRRNPSSKKITLTQTQVALAKRLGVPIEEYAKQVAQLNRR